MRELIRGVAIAEGRPERFVELDKVLADLTFPLAWAELWWHVPFSAVRTVIADALGSALKWEPSRDGALFPHLYGKLPLPAVRWTKPLPLDPDGRHVFPDLESEDM